MQILCSRHAVLCTTAMLLEIDGYDKMWEGSIASDPQLDSWVCFAIQRLNNPLSHDSNSRRVVVSEEEKQHNPNPPSGQYRDTNIACHVRKLSMEDFSDRLVEHFDITFQMHQVSVAYTIENTQISLINMVICHYI
jgi:hypothetical protein